MMPMQDGEMEEHPLLPTSIDRPKSGQAGGNNATVDITTDDDEDFDEETEEERKESDKVLFADGKIRGTSLILNDSILLLLHFLQMLAFIQSMSLRWTWPEDYLKTTYYVFLVNFDVWDFHKLQQNGTYKSVQGHFTASDLIGFDYWNILVAWGGFIFGITLIFLIIYMILSYRNRATFMVRIAQLQRVYIIIAQVISLPIGIALARVFHCTDDKVSVVEIDNTLECFKGNHWLYIGPAVAFAILFYILLPIWLILRTRSEMLNMNTDRHEGYLQLRETEYVQGLDVLYIVGNFHVFSSFKKHGAHFRAVSFVLTLLLLILYATLSIHIFVQATLIAVLTGCTLLAFIFIRPYRVKAFNVMLIMTYLCLTGDALLGAIVTNFSPFSLSSIWFTPTYIMYFLYFIQGIWVLSALIFLIYLIIRHMSCSTRCCPNPMWPTMTSDGLNKLNPQTRKYVRAILKGRTLVERCLAMPPLFAPAHELERQIQIINAYCREAEHLCDPIHDALWDLLDELIEAHSQIAPRSLFADSVKDSIKRTATDLMKVMPTFVRRLAQREYDFILIPPWKRRMLLKMYCMGIFLNGRREHLERQQLTLPAVKKVWSEEKSQDDYEDDGYYEDMYPEYEAGPDYRPVTALSLGMMNEAEFDDTVALREAEDFTLAHPLSQQGRFNLGFHDDDVSAILHDDIGDDLSQMLQGIPSKPATAVSGKRTANSNTLIDLESNQEMGNAGHMSMAKQGTSEDVTAGQFPPRSASQMVGSPAGSDGGSVQAAASPNRPGSGSIRPGSGTLSPEAGTMRPGSGTLSPEAASERPGSGSVRPGSGALRPGAGTKSPSSERPGSGALSPVSGSIRPGSGTQRPGSGTGSGTGRPGSGALSPGSGSLRPGSGTAKPGSGTRPGSGALSPGSAVRPGSGTLSPNHGRPVSPGSGSLRPGSGTARPGSGTTRPVSPGAGVISDVPSAPNSPRPGSAASQRSQQPDGGQGESERVISPLPGQVNDEPEPSNESVA